jgi:hypothetical protein
MSNYYKDLGYNTVLLESLSEMIPIFNLIPNFKGNVFYEKYNNPIIPKIAMTELQKYNLDIVKYRYFRLDAGKSYNNTIHTDTAVTEKGWFAINLVLKGAVDVNFYSSTIEGYSPSATTQYRSYSIENLTLIDTYTHSVGPIIIMNTHLPHSANMSNMKEDCILISFVCNEKYAYEDALLKLVNKD